MNKKTNDDYDNLGSKLNLCFMDKPSNIYKAVKWQCISCGNKFVESYIRLLNNNRGCLKCSYKHFNKK